MVTTKQLLATTILLGSSTFYGVVWADNQSVITTETNATANSPLTEEVISDPRLATERFIEHVNYARVSLAMKDASQAKNHINDALNLVAVLKNATDEQRQVASVESGRIVYKNEPSPHNYYFPIETGPVDVEKVSTGPFWAKNKGAAVTDAEIVYISLNLNGDRAEKDLDQTLEKIDKKDFSGAQSTLANLISYTVKEDKPVDVPIAKARDNMALARSFIAQRNYDGARYALGHANDALAAMEKDSRYSNRKDRTLAMRQEVANMQKDIRKNNPTIIEKADATIQQWWNDLRD